MPTPFIGAQEECGIAKEGTRGTATTPAYWIPKIDFSVENKPTYQSLDDSFGRIEDSDDQKLVMTGAEGNIVGRIGVSSFGLLLLALFGTDTPAPNGASYDHVFTVANNNQHPSLTIEMKNPQQQLAFTLAMLDSLEIRCEAGKVVEFTGSFKSKAGVAATHTPSYITTDYEFLMKHLSLKIAALSAGGYNAAGITSATALAVKSFTMKPVKNIERNDTFGSLDPSDINNKSFAFEGTIVLQYADTVFKALVDAGTPYCMAFDAKDTDDILSGALNPELKILFNKVYFTSFAKSTSRNDIVTQTITFKAVYNLVDSKMIQATLTNNVATY
jgi:hypothetical protein